MIKARHKPLFVRFFRFYSRFMLSRHFRQLNVKGTYIERGAPILLIGNHFSWWDGFIANYINNGVFGRRFHVMMLEEQLRSRMFLNKAGAYSIKKNSRDIVDSLQYTQDLLEDSNNLVCIYPQGEIQSIYHFPLYFEKGITKVIQSVRSKVQVVFMVSLIDYFSSKKPSLTIALKEYNLEGAISRDQLQNDYNAFMQEMIHQQKESSQ